MAQDCARERRGNREFFRTACGHRTSGPEPAETNFRNFRKRCGVVHPLGKTAKLRTVSRAESCRGFRQFPPGFRRFAPSSERAPFLKNSRFPPFPPVVLLSRPGGGRQQTAEERGENATDAPGHG